MKMSYIFGTLLLYPFMSFANPDVIVSTTPVQKNTLVSHYSNEQDKNLIAQLSLRTQDYPTQIVRTEGSLNALKMSCQDVSESINALFISKISYTKFTYNTYVFCSFDPKTQLATYFSIQSYFDPLSDSAIDELNAYRDEVNGREFLGTTFQIENAKGMIIAMNVLTGMKSRADAPLVLQHQDRSNFYFKSNFAMRNDLIADIYQRFYTNDPEKILPFLKKWLYSGAEKIYQTVLKRANYIELQPERIFLMQEDGDIFVSHFRYNFAHSCSQYENRRCL